MADHEPNSSLPEPMRPSTRLAEALALLALTVPLGGCDSPSAEAAPTDPLRAVAVQRAASRAADNGSPQERAVLSAMDNLKQAIIASDVAELTRIWTDDYTFVNPLGAIATKAQRIKNFSSGTTNVDVIDSEREITVRVYGDMAIVQNLSTLHGRFNGVPTDTDLRGTFVWVRRDGRWRLATNQLTPVVPPST